VGGESLQTLVRITRNADGSITREEAGGCRFVKLIGVHSWREP